MSVHLKELRLPEGMQLALGLSQAIKKHELNEEHYQHKLLESVNRPPAEITFQNLRKRTSIPVVLALVTVLVSGLYWLNPPATQFRPR